jgi:hypothetical protein
LRDVLLLIVIILPAGEFLSAGRFHYDRQILLLDFIGVQFFTKGCKGAVGRIAGEMEGLPWNFLVG